MAQRRDDHKTDDIFNGPQEVVPFGLYFREAMAEQDEIAATVKLSSLLPPDRRAVGAKIIEVMWERRELFVGLWINLILKMASRAERRQALDDLDDDIRDRVREGVKQQWGTR